MDLSLFQNLLEKCKEQFSRIISSVLELNLLNQEKQIRYKNDKL